MGTGISNSIETLEDLERAILPIIDLVKTWPNIKIGLIFDVIRDIKDFVDQLNLVLPELKDIDAQEAGILMQKSYQMVRNLIEKAKR